MRLDNIGIVVKAAEAYTWFKQKYGDKKLTDKDKQYAWRLYAINQVKEKARELTNE